jgi:hypothetical protein
MSRANCVQFTTFTLGKTSRLEIGTEPRSVVAGSPWLGQCP